MTMSDVEPAGDENLSALEERCSLVQKGSLVPIGRREMKSVLERIKVEKARADRAEKILGTFKPHTKYLDKHRMLWDGKTYECPHCGGRVVEEGGDMSNIPSSALLTLVRKWEAAFRSHDAGADAARLKGLALAANVLDGEAAGFRRCATDLSALIAEHEHHVGEADIDKRRTTMPKQPTRARPRVKVITWRQLKGACRNHFKTMYADKTSTSELSTLCMERENRGWYLPCCSRDCPIWKGLKDA